jgi:hypothetical protein
MSCYDTIQLNTYFKSPSTITTEITPPVTTQLKTQFETTTPQRLTINGIDMLLDLGQAAFASEAQSNTAALSSVRCATTKSMMPNTNLCVYRIMRPQHASLNEHPSITYLCCVIRRGRADPASMPQSGSPLS